MGKKQSSKTAKVWSLPPGHIQFLVILPPELAKLFTAEMVATERKKLPLARYIIGKYFRDKAMQKEYDEFREFQSGRKIPHFGDDEGESLRDTSRRKSAS